MEHVFGIIERKSIRSETKKNKVLVQKQKQSHCMFVGLIYRSLAYCRLILFGLQTNFFRIFCLRERRDEFDVFVQHKYCLFVMAL
jgi:hypothetical protein